MKPRIAHVVESLQIGGAEKLVFDFANGRGSADTTAVCLRDIGVFGKQLLDRGFQVDLVGLDSSRWRIVLRLARIFQIRRIALAHCHNPMAHLYGALAARLAGGIPVVVTKHGMRDFGQGWAASVNARLMRHSQVVAVSEEVRTMMNSVVRRPDWPIRYIANGIPLSPFQPRSSHNEARAGFGWPPDAFIIGIVARLADGKGHLPLLEALARLRQQVPSAMLVVVGDGVMRAEIEARIAALGLQQAVLLLGERQDVPQILAAIDMFCLPSETEGMPITLLEAMAASLPAVVSAVGAIPSMIDDGVSGVLIPRGDPAALDRALLAIAQEPEKTAAMGVAARRRVEKDFSVETALKNYEELYREMLGG
jgi:glycosyltransferase involved in cell wall biosynthesis